MPDISHAVHEALAMYLAAPTEEHRAVLLSEADRYKERWIAERATAPKDSSATRTAYHRKLEVQRLVTGVPVTLALQERNDGSSSWWTISWRTKYSVGGSNRRFYLTREGSWAIPAITALDMLDEMESLGGLADAYLDRRMTKPLETVVSIGLSADQRKKAIKSFTGPDEDWGSAPFFLVCSDPDAHWKKVLIVDKPSGIATFRSITTAPDYMPKKVLRPDVDWWLDNSMMDANVQQTRAFHESLRNYLSGSTEG